MSAMIKNPQMQEKTQPKSLMGLLVLEFMAIPIADTIAAILKIENVRGLQERSKVGKYETVGLSVFPEEPDKEWDALREVLEAKSIAGINQ